MYFPGKTKHLKIRHIDQFINSMYYYKVYTIFKLMTKTAAKFGPYCPFFFELADIFKMTYFESL